DREFAANAAHQLRTPLAALRLSLDEARDRPDPSSEVMHALEETERLTRIVDDLLRLSRGREGGTEPVDVAVICRALVDRLGENGGPAISLVGAGVAVANPQRVEQVISNLLDNGLRHADTQ